MIGMALGNEHRSYKGPYADLDAQIHHKVDARPKKANRTFAHILSALGIFS